MTDIGDLMAEDPLNLTDQNIVELITFYRSKRHQFNDEARTTKPKATSARMEKINKLELDL